MTRLASHVADDATRLDTHSMATRLNRLDLTPEGLCSVGERGGKQPRALQTITIDETLGLRRGIQPLASGSV